MVHNDKMQQPLLLGLKILFASLSIFMIGLVIATSLKSNLGEATPRLNQEPWFVTTIVDFYFNIAIISTWVVYKEKKLVHAILWISAFIALGSIATAFYVVLQLSRLTSRDSLETVLLKSK